MNNTLLNTRFIQLNVIYSAENIPELHHNANAFEKVMLQQLDIFQEIVNAYWQKEEPLPIA